jgi:two-component system, LytTR family, response regulator
MKQIKCIIVEDEPLAAKVLRDYIAQVPFLECRGSFKDAVYATEFLQGEMVDLIFLDIHLPRVKGMSFIRTLSHPPAIIITTAYHQYAVEGFELNVTDYLLKPVEFDRFALAVNKAQKQIAQQPAADKEDAPVQKRNYIFLTVNRRHVKINHDDILYIESLREYVKVYTQKQEYITKMSTGEMEALLPAAQFKRVHRSFIVALDKIEAFTAGNVEINGRHIPVGRAYRDALQR